MAAKRHRKRTHVEVEDDVNVPKSMVIKMGDPKRKPTKALTALVRDFRQVMQPHTAAKLKERRSNKLKDYFVMAGPLGVTNFFIFSQSASGNTTLRIGRTPRGPTLYFRVLEYSLNRDIQKAQKRPHALTPTGPELQHPPILVMNNFSKEKSSDIDALITSVFQNMVPTIHVDPTTSLNSVRRVLLLTKDPETGNVEMRHYAVVTRVVGSSKAVKKLEAIQKGQKEIPDLHHLRNLAQYMEDPNLSDSENEDEVIDAAPSGPEISQSRQVNKVKKAVKLVEVGPRMTLQLLKVEEGLCAGKTLYHNLVQRSEAEIKALEKRHRQKDAERARRREIQEANLRKKREAQEARGSRRSRGAERLKLRKPDNQGEGDDAEDEGQKPQKRARFDDDFHGFDSDSSPDANSDSGASEQEIEDMNDYELDAEAAYESDN